ncbi:GntR family transcriptional regulator [Floricoccus tropicus]|uniref:GntR family transcriptional regulator n=2 Tax=Floricoccus TaxID=1930830 RepID=A0A1E8GLY5_9LACT|nr:MULTISPECIES: GntR family transcriptional regulator [Floricoccus]OFI47587.1 GntR family transcriptional regulator [Floricoccus penangensis]OFI49252.1 GntR family transcriptional regulator [Floricoccus tropicus]URZ87898.1 GntR family transcriptional regulator [Floricoccus penangensis]
MDLIIQNSSDEPIYQQMYNQIKDQILSGQLKKDDLLPSIRKLSKELKVSVITTTRAYTELEKDGYVTIVQGKGCYVNSIDNSILEERIYSEIEDNFSQILRAARLVDLSNEEVLNHFKMFMEMEDNDE